MRLLPAASIALAVISAVAESSRVTAQAPLEFAAAVATRLAPAYTSTVEPASAVPAIACVVLFVVTDEVEMATDVAVSIVSVCGVTALTFPAASVAVTATVFAPAAGVWPVPVELVAVLAVSTSHVPLVAVTVQVEVLSPVPSVTLTSEPASAKPEITGVASFVSDALEIVGDAGALASTTMFCGVEAAL